MHIPDGYLGPPTYAALWATMAPVWIWASRRIKRDLDAARIPHLAMASAFSLTAMVFALPLPGGTTGHICGAALVSILLGPWACVAAVSVALMIQAFVFGDGGITSLGANCFNMAFVGGFVGYWAFRLIARKDPLEPILRPNPEKAREMGFREVVAASLGAYFSVNVSALFTAAELGVQPMIHQGGMGSKYFPYGLSITLPAVMLPHLTLVGPLEAGVTALVLRFLRGIQMKAIPMGKMAIVFVFGGWLVGAPKVMAHEFWIEGKPPELQLVFGHGSSKAEFDHKNVKRVLALDSKGERLHVATEAGEKVLKVKIPDNTSLVVVEVDNGYWSKTIYGWRSVGKTKASRVIESIRSINFAKAILSSGEVALRFIEGVQLDLVPKEDPCRLKSGDTLTLEVIFQGKPLGGREVTDGEHGKLGVSDAQGIVKLPVKTGRHSFAVTHKVPVQGDPEADFLSFTATLTLEVK